MTYTISANPGNNIRLGIQITDGYGTRYDGYFSPQVDFILNPQSNELPGFPSLMTYVTTGVYFYQFQIPTGLFAIGTYLASLSWIENNIQKSELYNIHVSLPFGNLTASGV